MKITKVEKVIVELESWEAEDLFSIMERIKTGPTINRNQFSIRERGTARRLMDGIRKQIPGGK